MNLVITFVEIIVVMSSVSSLPETGLFPSTFLYNQRLYNEQNTVIIMLYLFYNILTA